MRRLIGFARRQLDERVRPKVDEEDVAQSVFRTLFHHLPERRFILEDPDTFWPLLAEITLRKCGHWDRHFRTSKRDIRREFTPPAEPEGEEEPVATTGPRPEDGIVLNELLDLVSRSLRDPRARQVCEKRLEGKTVSEIAAELNCKEATVNRRLRQIKKVLSEMLPRQTRTD